MKIRVKIGTNGSRNRKCKKWKCESEKMEVNIKVEKDLHNRHPNVK